MNACFSSSLPLNSPPNFHTSAGIPSLSGALPSCVVLIADIISSKFGGSSRLDTAGRCTRASLPSSERSPWSFGSLVVGQTALVALEMNRYNVDIAVLSETRLPGYDSLEDHGYMGWEINSRKERSRSGLCS